MSIEQAIQNLADAINNLAKTPTPVTQAPAAAPVAPVTQAAPVAPVAQAAPAAPAAPVAPVTQAAPVTEAAAEAMTIDQVRAKLQPVVQEFGPAVVKTELEKLGSETLTGLAVDKYATLLAAVSAAIGKAV